MSQSPLPVRNNELPLDNGTNNYSVSRIFGMLIEPEHGRVSPDFLEYQDVEGPSMEEVNTGVETGTGDTGTFPTTILISTMPTDNTALIHCNPNDHLAPGLNREYQHDITEGQSYFVPPGHAQQVLASLVTPTSEEEPNITPYQILSEDEEHDSDKKNCEDAAKVSRGRQDAQGVGPHCRGKQGGVRRRSMAEAETGPVQLYHPWQQRSVGTQRSESPIPDRYVRNAGQLYILFPIHRDDGHTVSAKYVATFMVANPYALGRLTHDGPAHTAEIHASPRYDYKEVACEQDLRELTSAWHQVAKFDTALAQIKDVGLTAEVHRYRHLVGRLGQLDKQMEQIEQEMATLIPQKHQSAERLLRAQAVCRIHKPVGQRVRRVSPWEEELSLQTQTNLRVHT